MASNACVSRDGGKDERQQTPRGPVLAKAALLRGLRAKREQDVVITAESGMRGREACLGAMTYSVQRTLQRKVTDAFGNTGPKKTLLPGCI